MSIISSKKTRAYTPAQVKKLYQTVNIPITINGITDVPLIHAINHADLRLFKALLKLNADYEKESLSFNKKGKKQRIESYLLEKAHQDPLCYKPFLNELSNRKIKRLIKRAKKNILFVFSVMTAVAMTIFDIGLVLINLLPSSINLTYLGGFISGLVSTAGFGFLLNTAWLGYKLYRNLTHPTKSTGGHLTTLFYDLINYGLKSLGYISFLAIGASPLTGVFILTASITDATRGISKLIRAVKDHIQLKRKINDSTTQVDTEEHIKAIRSYQRANFKIATISTNLALAGILVGLVAMSCFMPLTIVGTASIFASTIAIYGFIFITKLACNRFFQHQTEQQIAKYYEKEAPFNDSNTDINDESASHAHIIEQLHTTKISSSPEIINADEHISKEESSGKNVKLSKSRYQSFKLLEKIIDEVNSERADVDYYEKSMEEEKNSLFSR